MQYLFKFILLFFMMTFHHCNQFDYNKPIDANVDITILKEDKSLENAKNKIQDIFDNISTTLNDQEKNIIKTLLFFKLRPETIKFSLENLTIFYNKIDNSYNSNYYLNAIKEDPFLEEKIKQVIKQIFQSSLRLNKDQIPVKLLPLRGSDQITLIDHINPLNEDSNDFLKEDNIDINLNLQDGHITILFKKTYLGEFFKNDLLRQESPYNVLKNYVTLPTDYLSPTKGKEIAGHGLAVFGGITFKKDLPIKLIQRVEQTIQTELEKGIDYYQDGTPPEVGSLLHTLIHDTILKTGNEIQVKALGTSLADAFAAGAGEANIKKIYLMKNHLVITLHDSSSSNNLLEWLETVDSFITSRPEVMGRTTFNGRGIGTFNNIQTLNNGLRDYTGDFSESLTDQIVTYNNLQTVVNLGELHQINDIGGNPNGKIVRFRLKNMPIGLEVRAALNVDVATSYKHVLTKLSVFDEYFLTITNVFGDNAKESLTNLNKIAPSLGQLYLFRNFTRRVPINSEIWICPVLVNQLVTVNSRGSNYWLSTDSNPEPSTTQDITIGITSNINRIP